MKTLSSARAMQAGRKIRRVSSNALKRTSRSSSCACRSSTKNRSTQVRISGETKERKMNKYSQRKHLTSLLSMTTRRLVLPKNYFQSLRPLPSCLPQAPPIPSDTSLLIIKRNILNGHNPKLQPFNKQERHQTRRQGYSTMTMAFKSAIYPSSERHTWP